MTTDLYGKWLRAQATPAASSGAVDRIRTADVQLGSPVTVTRSYPWFILFALLARTADER